MNWVNAMIIDFQLSKSSSHFWGRIKGTAIRQEIEGLLEKAKADDIVIVDLSGVEVMDYSFSNEVFCKLISRVPKEYSGRHLVLKSVSEYVKENLDPALRDLKLMAFVMQDSSWFLIGNSKPTDIETLKALEELGSAELATLAKKLDISVNACSNRLNKLAEQGLIKKSEVDKPLGNEKYLYRWLF